MSTATPTGDEATSPSIDFDRGTEQATGDTNRHTDADSMRRRFGIAPYDPAAFDYGHVYPNLVEHHWRGPPTGASQRKGGTDAVVFAKPGKGKSTLLLNLALRWMEVNGEAVIWRSSQSRGEWTPFAPWARLCLPSSCKGDITARLDPADPTDDPVPVALEDVARDVVWYDGPRDLNHNHLQPGAFHAVFPDPTLRGCQAVYEQSDHDVDGVAFDPDHPTSHWWYGWLLARVEHGPHHWTAFVDDEVGNLLPEHAPDDEYGTLPKIELVADAWVDFRRKGLSFAGAGHNEGAVHHVIRKKLTWRWEMWGTANPTRASQVLGASRVPMEADHTSSYDFGKALVWTEQNFEREVVWSDLSDAIGRELSIELPTVEPTEGGKK